MKKLYYLLFLLPLAFFVSCSDDDDFSPVNVTLTLNGVTEYNGTFYTVSGEGVIIEGLTAKAENGKTTLLQDVMCNLGSFPIVPSPEYPYGSFTTENLPTGDFNIGVTGLVLQEGSSIKTFAINYPLVIVESQDDLPAGASEIGTYSLTATIKTK